MTLAELIYKYNNPTTGLFKNNSPLQAISAAFLREFVDDISFSIGDLQSALPYAQSTHWLSLINTGFSIDLQNNADAQLVLSVAERPGLLEFNTDQANGRAYVLTQAFFLENALAETIVAISSLSTAPEAFVYNYGYRDSLATVNAVNGIYFEYSHSINLGNWRVSAWKAGVQVFIDTLITVVAGQYYRLRVTKLITGSTVVSIDGQIVGVVDAFDNPVTLVQYCNGIRKTNGAADRIILIDKDLLIL